jgi:hypothetical protein
VVILNRLAKVYLGDCGAYANYSLERPSSDCDYLVPGAGAFALMSYSKLSPRACDVLTCGWRQLWHHGLLGIVDILLQETPTKKLLVAIPVILSRLLRLHSRNWLNDSGVKINLLLLRGSCEAVITNNTSSDAAIHIG